MNLTGKEAYTLMLKAYPDVMNIHELCEVLGISVKTGYRLLQNGNITCMKIGRTYRIPKVYVLQYLKIISSPSIT